jgi:hypothetical protein
MDPQKTRRGRLGRLLLAVAFGSLWLGATTARADPRRGAPPDAFVDQGYYLDPRGVRVAFEPMYTGWFGAQRYGLHPVRALIENVGLLGIEVGVYWSDFSSSVVDWQFPDLGTKLTSNEAFRFDDNLLTTNYVFHPFAGTSHYAVTRSNGFGVWGGFAAAAGSSAIYELLLEWKELVSLNDLVVTPIGGTAMGEFFYQLGNYINSEPPAGQSHAGVAEALHQGTKTTLGLPRDVHDLLDRPSPPPSAARDNLGLSSAYWHRFRVYAAQEGVDDGRGPVRRLLGADATLELAAMPGFLRAGQFARAFSNGNFTSCTARILLDRNAHDTELAFDSHLLGHYQQDIRDTASGRRGYANELAFSMKLDYVTQSWGGRSDSYGIVHVLRPVERAWLALGPAEVHFGADISADFASIYSIAYESYTARYGEPGTKSSLKRHGYAHGFGFSGAGVAAFKLSGFELGARGEYGHYESLDGVERFQEQVTSQPHGSETLVRVLAYLRAEPEGSSFSGKLELLRDLRVSRLGEFEEQRDTVRFATAVGARF